MVFSRISVDFRTVFLPWSSSPLVDDDAGDLGLAELPDGVGYLPFIVDSPRLDVFFCSVSYVISRSMDPITSFFQTCLFCAQEALDVPLLQTPSPPYRVVRHSVSSLSSSTTSPSPGVLRASPSWAGNGLRIAGLLSSPPMVMPGPPDPLCDYTFVSYVQPRQPPLTESGSRHQ